MTDELKKVTEELDWKDINHETYRTYVFSSGAKITITKPVLLNVSASGGHRVLDDKSVAHYIPSGWIHLYWETDDGNAFRF